MNVAKVTSGHTGFHTMFSPSASGNDPLTRNTSVCPWQEAKGCKVSTANRRIEKNWWECAIIDHHNWLVVGPPLWKIWKSIGMISNPIYGKIKNGNQTTNQIRMTSTINYCQPFLIMLVASWKPCSPSTPLFTIVIHLLSMFIILRWLWYTYPGS